MPNTVYVIEMVGERNLRDFSGIVSFAQGLSAITATCRQYAPSLMEVDSGDYRYFSLVYFSVESPARSRFLVSTAWISGAVALFAIASSATSILADYPAAKIGYKELSYDISHRVEQAKKKLVEGLRIFGDEVGDEIPFMALRFLDNIKSLPPKEARRIIGRGERLNKQLRDSQTRHPQFRMQRQRPKHN